LQEGLSFLESADEDGRSTLSPAACGKLPQPVSEAYANYDLHFDLKDSEICFENVSNHD
jgi:hypothetical protein